jgi:hypothetical protein
MKKNRLKIHFTRKKELENKKILQIITLTIGVVLISGSNVDKLIQIMQTFALFDHFYTFYFQILMGRGKSSIPLSIYQKIFVKNIPEPPKSCKNY